MALLPVAEALERLLADVAPCPAETVPLHEASGRVLAEPLFALRTQPPFSASAMDGYAVRAADVATVPARLVVKGVAAAGKHFAGAINTGEAIRIFTGAPVPEGADAIAIQENVSVVGDGLIEVFETVAANRHIRAKGIDFHEGQQLLDAGRALDPAALSLAASANHPALTVVGRPLVAIIATGDELLPPGSVTGPDQIIASNTYGVAAIAQSAGARVLDLGIAGDSVDAISALVTRAMDAGADVIVTLGGASVGDHDLVQSVLTGLGLDLDFWKIAMRPGKPLMFGRLGATRCIGLPGNPVASLVCSHLFLKPLLAALGGRSFEPRIEQATLAIDMPANDVRQDYVRATVSRTGSAGGAGLVATPFSIQDSSMLRTLSDAHGLVIRAPFAPAAKASDTVDVLMLR